MFRIYRCARTRHPPSQDPIEDKPVEQDGKGTITPEDLKQQLLPDDKPVEEKQQEVLDPKDRIRKFVGSYKAGDCMYLQPIKIAANAAEIEGFASRTPPFISFDSDFTQTQGFEAKIQVNLVK